MTSCLQPPEHPSQNLLKKGAHSQPSRPSLDFDRYLPVAMNRFLYFRTI